ncbi:MAG: EF-P lysine aminoacylase EpmA [SAR324 cluster bacterium]|nr:EF-P lysine aminoacylase EpmA [SAR324 cluster bacterium]
MTPRFPPGVPCHGRILELPKPAFPKRLCLLVEDALYEFEAAPGLLQGLAEGDLVEFQVDAGQKLTSLAREGGPGPQGFDSGGDALRWRRPGDSPARMALLRLRGRVLGELRAYFADEGFLEVDTPVLVPAPSPEAQLAPLRGGDSYLITSPEFQLKRMLVGGCEKIYRIGPVFRGGEAGRHHNPEFTMLEWYRAHRDLEAMVRDLESLLARLAPLATPSIMAEDPCWPGNAELSSALGRRPFARATIAELFRRQLGMQLQGVTTAEALREAALGAGLAEAADLPADFEQAFFTLWDQIEPHLGPQPLLVCEWPAPLASLARLKAEDSTVAERMELYAGGLELANGFAELTDGAEQRRRFEADLETRRARGLPVPPLDEKFLAALGQGMPPAAGMALGVERLVMLLGGATHIRQVLPFAWDEV